MHPRITSRLAPFTGHTNGDTIAIMNCVAVGDQFKPVPVSKYTESVGLTESRQALRGNSLR